MNSWVIIQFKYEEPKSNKVT